MTDRTERAPSAFRLNLEQQKNRAKELLCAVKAGDTEALSRFAAARSDSVAPDSPDAPQKEQDTWCQTILVHLLAHYANAKRPRVLELIALNEFPGAERLGT